MILKRDVDPVRSSRSWAMSLPAVHYFNLISYQLLTRFNVYSVRTIASQLCSSLTRYRHIKTAEQRTIIQQYGDWYTGR